MIQLTSYLLQIYGMHIHFIHILHVLKDWISVCMQMKTGIYVTCLFAINILNVLCDDDVHGGYFKNNFDPDKNCENEKLMEKLEKEGRCVGPFSKGEV